MKSNTTRLLLSAFSAGFLLFSSRVSGNLNVYYRDCISLNGTWNIIIDPYDNGYLNYRLEPMDEDNNPWSVGYYADKKMQSPDELIEYDFDKSKEILVPGDWNTQDSQLLYYEGSVWYRKKFDMPQHQEGHRIMLYFGAVNYRADVYLNGKKLGFHIGGFTPFCFEVTKHLKENDNSLVLRVNNTRLREGVPTVNTDWWNYGGITRDVKLVVLPAQFIRDFTVVLQENSENTIQGQVLTEGGNKGDEVLIRIPELNINHKALVNDSAIANFEFQVRKLQLWSPENPRRYRIEISIASDKLIDSVGFRNIAVKNKQLLLNDKPVFLKGISVHEEYYGSRVNEVSESEKLVGWIKELGCNFARLAHYPHNEDMVRTAEREGIMLWSEIPVYWTIDWQNKNTYENAVTQLRENIMRDKNRANIIIWSVANETPVVPERNDFLKRLVKEARNLDASRLISAALEKHYRNDSVAVVEDPMAEHLDIVAFNEYVGWYDGLPGKCDRIRWKISYDKPVFISEFGGGAKYGIHGNSNERWTEEFQEDLYRKSLKMIDSIEGLCGISPWILTDFRSPRRQLPGIQDGFNRKGLLSEKGEKKKAFFVLREYYRKK